MQPILQANGIRAKRASRDTHPRAVRDKQLMRADRNSKKQGKKRKKKLKNTDYLEKKEK